MKDNKEIIKHAQLIQNTHDEILTEECERYLLQALQERDTYWKEKMRECIEGFDDSWSDYKQDEVDAWKKEQLNTLNEEG